MKAERFLVFLMALACASMIILQTSISIADELITNLHFDIYTGDDNKDRGDELKFSILLDNKIIEQTNAIHGDLVFREGGSPNTWDINLNRKFMESECPRMSFIVEKIGSTNGWYAAFKLTANNHIIFYEPPRDSNGNFIYALYGHRNPIEIITRDGGVDGIRFHHLKGPNEIEYKFNRCS